VKGNVAQDFRPHAVSQADIFETDQRQVILSLASLARKPLRRRRSFRPHG
jgi:hypothetical protein